jgi:hypothetical protein
MAKSPPRSSQIPMLFPIGRASSTGAVLKAQAKSAHPAAVRPSSHRQDCRDALIERLRRDGFFELRKK